MDKVFWNVCCLVLGGTTNGSQFKFSQIYEYIQRREILATSIVIVDGTHVKPFLLDVEPICFEITN